MESTTYSNKIEILSELWSNYRHDEEFQDFVEYNDIGLPLAYLLANEIVKKTEMSERFIEETFSLLLAGLGIDEDTGFENLDEILGL
jgi:hypothetical protein